jgi:hypothetical protein
LSDYRFVMFRGYWHVETPKGLRAWHRIVCIENHGPIPKGWVVHHVDADKLNNSPDNLIALPEKMHNTIHQIIPLPQRETLVEFVSRYLNGERPDRKALKKAVKKKEKTKLKKIEAKLKRIYRRVKPRPKISSQDMKDVEVKRYTYIPPKPQWNGRN